MRSTLHYFLASVLCLTVIVHTSGQATKPVYEALMQKGKLFMDPMTTDYQKANKYFKAAAISTDDLQQQRQALMMADSADRKYVLELEAQRKEARDAYTRARLQADAAQKAKLEAEASKRYSDALYLAFITDKEVQGLIRSMEKTHRDSLMMQLAHYGTQLTSKYVQSIHSVFGRTVYNATRTIVNDHQGAIARVALTRDGAYYAQGRDGMIAHRPRLPGPGIPIRTNDFVQDFQPYDNGEFLVVKRDARKIAIYQEPSTGLFVEFPFEQRVNQAFYHAGSGTLCVALQGGAMQFVKVSDGTRTMVEHAGDWVRGLAVSPDSSLILSRGSHGTIAVWDLSGNVVLPPFRAHDTYVYDAVFAPDGQQILTCSADHTAKIWGLDGTLQETLSFHQNPVFKARYSADGSRILTMSIGNDVAIWDRSGTKLWDLREDPAFGIGSIEDVYFHPDGKSMLTISGEHVQWVEHDVVAQTIRSYDHGAAVRDIDVSPDGNFLLTYGDDHLVQVWALDTLSYEETDADGHLLLETTLADDLSMGNVTRAGFSPNSDLVWIGMSSGAVQIIPMPHVVSNQLAEQPVIMYYDSPDEEFIWDNNLVEILGQFDVAWRTRGDLIEIRNQ